MLRFVLLMIFILTSTSIYHSKDTYDRDDYKYNHKKARQKLIAYYDPYSGLFFKDPQDMEIDHIVSLKLAHDLGAYHWTGQNRKKHLLMI